MHANDTLPELAPPSVTPFKLGLLVVALAALGAILVTRFAADEENRELINWQNKLGLIADSRTADVDAWLTRNFSDLGQVAANPSLQLYLTTLETMKPGSAGVPTPMPGMPAPAASAAPDMGEDPAQVTFLKNLLLVTADRLGFVSNAPDPLKDVHANVNHATGSGLAIVDKDGRILVGTNGLPEFSPALRARLRQVPKGKPALLDMFVDQNGETELGFALPIFPIQGDPTASEQIGTLVAVKPLGEDLLQLLRQPGATESTLEAMLLRKDENSVTYLAPPVPKGKALATRFDLSTPTLDAAMAVNQPGEFARARDREARRVLMTSRVIAHAPWVLMLHIDRDQALAESDAWRARTVLVMCVSLLALIASVVAAWWHGSSRRAMLLSEQTGRLASHSLAQEKLLRLVTDNQPEPIFIADKQQVVRFANQKAAEMFSGTPDNVTGKSLAALLGAAAASAYIDADEEALEKRKSVTRTHKNAEGALRILRSEHIPLDTIPIDALPQPTPGVLVIDQDVTEIVLERERRERILRQLIGTLVRIVDARDPNAANHSAYVALIAREVAREMDLPPLLIDVADTAGNLLNLGKIAVSSAILTKTSALAQDEIQAIRESSTKTVEILQGVEFDGPVVDTLRQAAERFDGTGPLHLKGDAILITARIVAVANSFIGMVSPRAYRGAITVEQATGNLLKNIDTQFDRKVVVALINFIENKNGKALLKLKS